MSLPLLIALTTVVPGALMVAWGGHMLRRASRSRGWAKVPGTILESRVLDRGKTRSPQLVFDYHVAGQRHVGRRLWVGPASISVSGDWANRKTARYPVGSQVHVAVDPVDPTYAVLEPGRQAMHWLPLAIASVVVVAGAVCAIGLAQVT